VIESAVDFYSRFARHDGAEFMDSGYQMSTK
jgi:hypothetical protein